MIPCSPESVYSFRWRADAIRFDQGRGVAQRRVGENADYGVTAAFTRKNRAVPVEV